MIICLIAKDMATFPVFIHSTFAKIRNTLPSVARGPGQTISTTRLRVLNEQRERHRLARRQIDIRDVLTTIGLRTQCEETRDRHAG
jgi:hypothetical protein